MRVLITRPRSESAEFSRLLNEIGVEAVFFPTISIHPVSDMSILDRAIRHLQDYDWLVFTSANAADILLSRIDSLGIKHFPEKLRIAAVGPKTAERLLKCGVVPDFTPEVHTGEAIVPGLGSLNGCWVLLPSADIAHDRLPEAIQQANGFAHVVTAYHTLPAEPDRQGLAAIQEGIDFITFTSGSTARNFVTLIEHEGLDPFHLPGDPAIACIGPKTALSARELGYSPEIVANEYTVVGLAAAISAYLQEKKVDGSH